MAIYFNTNNPAALLAAFKQGIERKEIVTWEIDPDGDFTHTPPQWRNQAWLRPVLGQDRLVLNIIGRNNTAMPLEVYAVYHGRFIEAMIRHCRQRFTLAMATPLPTANESVTIAA
jgi:hypothetical protein